jgi:hypothetical protein
MFSSSAAGGANTIAFLSISAAKRFEKLPKPSISSHSPARMPVEPLPLIVATLTFVLAGFVKGRDRARAADRLDGLAQSRHGARQGRFAPDRAFLRHQRLAIGSNPHW